MTNANFTGATNAFLDGLTLINCRNTTYSPFYSNGGYKWQNLIAQDCQISSGNGGAFNIISNSANLIAINCKTGSSYSGGGFWQGSNNNTIIAINCSSSNGGGINGMSNSNNILTLNCIAVNNGGGCCSLTNCTNAKIVNCSAAGSGNGGSTYGDINCKNFLILNCWCNIGTVMHLPSGCQNYTLVNNIGTSCVNINGGATPVATTKNYNFVCLNNKTTSGTIIGFYLGSANTYYKLYNCRADAAIGFAANAATNADIQNFYLIQNNNEALKFANTGTFPIVGTLPYENVIVNSKYINGDFGNFNIPQNSVLAGAGYWEDGFSFGWDIDGKPRNAAHCSIGVYEPDWA